MWLDGVALGATDCCLCILCASHVLWPRILDRKVRTLLNRFSTRELLVIVSGLQDQLNASYVHPEPFRQTQV